MSISIPQFWKLLHDSGLVPPERCRTLASEFERVPGSSDASSATALAKWLIRRQLLTPFQAKILLGSRSGPFHYGAYRVFDRIAEGRWVGCFRATHLPTNHRVLLQFQTGRATQDPARWAAAIRRTDQLRRVVHPNVARLFELVDEGPYKFAVGEDLEGQTLADRLAAGGPLPPAESCAILRSVAAALARLHEVGQVHSDVCPENVWIEPNGEVKLLCSPVIQVGTNGDPDVASDLHGLGSTLYQSLVGQPPTGHEEGTEAIRKARAAQKAVLPPDVARLLSQLLAEGAESRGSATAAVEVLTASMDPSQLAIPASPPAPTFAAYAEAIEKKLAARPPVPPAAPIASQPPATPGFSSSTPIRATPVPPPTPLGGSSVSPVAVSPVFVSPASFSPVTVSPIASAANSAAPDTDVATVVVTADPAFRRSLSAPKPRRWVLPAIAAVAVLLLAGALVAYKLANRTEPARGPEEIASTTDDRDTRSYTEGGDGSTGDRPVEPPGISQVVLDGDETHPWESPTAGPPIPFELVPPGSQIFIVARPAELLVSAEGRRVLQALGPEFDGARQRWESACGFALSEIERMYISLHDDPSGPMRAAFVVHLREPLTSEALLEKWGQPAPVISGTSSYYQARGWSFYVPDRAGVFVMGSPEEIEGVIEFQGGAPALGPMQQLLAASDSDRHVTVLFTPHALFNELLRDGREYYFGPARKARTPADWLIGDGVDAASLSLHLYDTSYLEMRFFGRMKDRHTLASEFRDRFRQVPDKIEQYSAASIPHPHWRIVANRYPSMVRFLASQMRVGVERDEAIVNVALPETACHNLVFCGLMMLISPEVVVAADPEPSSAGPQTLAELLEAKTRVSFDQLSLEDAIEFIETAVREDHPRLPFEFRVVILGSDLQKDGITQNQQVRDFKLPDSTVADALTGIVVKAQATGKPASAPEQKLIWVVGPDPNAPEKQVVLVTTRAAAAEKAYSIPQPFLDR